MAALSKRCASPLDTTRRPRPSTSTSSAIGSHSAPRYSLEKWMWLPPISSRYGARAGIQFQWYGMFAFRSPGSLTARNGQPTRPRTRDNKRYSWRLTLDRTIASELPPRTQRHRRTPKGTRISSLIATWLLLASGLAVFLCGACLRALARYALSKVRTYNRCIGRFQVNLLKHMS
jgi:hypothetical protein